ncbi:MAG TPA: DUF2283 domain-containing protein [Chloroflexota bacterium]|nr:DUF2283 domain-containing protein [Chloroflexota bacterium]HUM71119.1 DUF2283 domain-containing protein [Chloroflexota bacterium]
MQVTYNTKTDVLYIRLDSRQQEVINQRLNEDIVLDIGEEDKIIGIEILDASSHLNLDQLLPVQIERLPEMV